MPNKELKKLLDYCLNVKECSKCDYAKEEDCMLTCSALIKECLNENYAEVVRCKDCKFWTPMDNGISWNNKGRTDGECEMLWKQHCAERHLTQQDNFCSYGERKDS